MKLGKSFGVVFFLLLNSYLLIASDKKESPYFELTSPETKIENLPLLSTTANVEIDGVIADIGIIQVYKNTGNVPIEAVYTFPASSKAAIYFMKMTIKDRVIVSEIAEKQEARKRYEDAKQEGKSTSLLTESRPNVFTMNVANIMPDDTITIEFRYAEILEPKEGIYEFVFPAVVGPRYRGINESDPTPVINYKDVSKKELFKYDINIKLNSVVPLSFLKSETHKIIVKDIKENEKSIKLEPDISNGNRDFVLNYQLRGDKIQTGMILTENGDENFFLLMLQPPKRVENAEELPKEYVFLVDISGSQTGFPLEISRKLMLKVIDALKETDKFNILSFSTNYHRLFEESEFADDNNKEDAKEFVENLNTEGGTDILQAIKAAMSDEADEEYSKIIAVLTDGFVENEIESFNYITENLNKVNFFGFGIGSSVNRFFIDGLAKVGLGESFFALDIANPDSIINEFIKYTKTPILKDVNVDFGDFWASETFPEKVPDLFAERPLVVIGKWKKPLKGTIKVSGMTPKEKLTVTIPLDKFGELYTGDGLKYLWARKKVELYSDLAFFSNKYVYNQDNVYKQDIIDLGLKYNLVTKYTSFVAVDNLVRNDEKKVITVNQPVASPKGVEFSGSGGYSGRVYSGGGYSGGGGESMNNPCLPTYERAPLYIGPVFGMDFYSMDNNFAYKNKYLLPDELPSLNAHSYRYGFAWFNPIGELVDTRLFYTLSLTYNSNYMNTEKNYTNSTLNNRLLDLSGHEADSLNTTLGYRNETEFSYIGFDFQFQYLILYPLSINLELGFQYIVKSNLIESFEINDSQSAAKFKNIENTQRENDNRKLILFNDAIPDLNTFQIPLGVGLSYDLILPASFFRIDYSFGTNLFDFQKNISNKYFTHKIKLIWFWYL